MTDPDLYTAPTPSSAPETMPPKGRIVPVLVVWGIIGVLFVGFNLFWWPAARYYRNAALEFFPEQAERYQAEGRSEEACRRLEEGINAFHPTESAPYRQYAAMADTYPGEANQARHAHILAEFYTGLEAISADPMIPWRKTAQQLSVDWPEAAFSVNARQALATVLKSFGAAYPSASPPDAWPAGEQLGLLYAAYGAIRFGGVIGRTGIKSPVCLLAYSSGNPPGSRRAAAHLFVGGTDYAGTRRGLHVALVDPSTGSVIGADSFDLRESEEEADRLTAWLKPVKKEVIALFAVRDDAARNITDAVEEAFKDFGLTPEALVLNRRCFYDARYSFSAIGVKGAAAGTALQAWSPGQWRGVPGHPVACVVLPQEAAS